MSDKSLRWAIGLGLLAAALLVAGVVALTAPDGPDAPAGSAPPGEHVMDEDARCAHMPEHCAGGGA